ncbi:biopolymer transporter ExbD [Blochmannia endosymbiont of Camponotus sp.]|uniref:biopolymer transporter ExbD n=1 Tax=Blochmannia endosymbiont of Camponotus sp. TaxID=700220 RepID=UPI002023CB34|nr:biopolymer transporter ExbD [Blochmannia endosymbiont of Camponotus sp.]URJ30047.1 biopolymer transporter ExbD [Blochmannia endosymbiont of Camponotus sp.]URJ31058.1 biopolymer transporter ExbD [Blochmannia endosymbiont of Camponotus sp.]
MKKQRIKRAIKSDINIIPFLDILLVLLIIFIIIPSKLIQSFEVNLPNSEVATNIVSNEKLIMTIEILGMGFYNLIINNKHMKKICLDQISSEVNNQIYITPDITCLIAASKAIAYDEIIKVLSLLSKIGVHSIGMITNPTT